MAIELARYIEWFLVSPQADADLEYHLKVPVSEHIAAVIRRSVLERMTCDGQPLMDMVRRQKYDEAESLRTWKLPVQIVTPITAVVILCLLAYAIRQRMKYLRMLDHDDWKIDFVVPKKAARTLGDPCVDGDGLRSSGNSSDGCDADDVATRPLRIAPVFDVNRKVKQTLMRMRNEIEHANVARFFGISSPHVDAVYLVEQYCANGSLVDFLRSNEHIADRMCRYVVCADVAGGMAYLHRHDLIHGNLSIDKCHVDSRWTVKIVDWEYTAMYDVVRRTDRNQARIGAETSVLHFLCDEADDGGSKLFPTFRHLAPEIQKDGRLSEPTRAGDVYSFGVIIYDVFAHFPSDDQRHTGDEAQSSMPFKARQLTELACDKASVKRPTFERLEKSLRCIGKKTNLLDRCADFELRV